VTSSGGYLPNVNLHTGTRPSDLHSRLAVSIAALLDDHLAITGAAADGEVAIARAFDALLVTERSDTVLITNALRTCRQRD
jgi:hypothetical protein